MQHSVIVSHAYRNLNCRTTYKISQMDVSVRIKQDVVWLDIPVYDALLVYVADGTAQLCDPEAHSVFGKRLPRNVKAQVSAVH
jgi:hypothetical protein